MAVVGQSITLSTVAFDLLWERLALGAFPVVLQLRSHGDTFEQRNVVLDATREQLQARGLLDGTSVDSRLERWLHVLAHPEDEVDLRWRDGSVELRATVVRQGEVTVRAVRRANEVTFTPVTPGSMPSAVVDLLPECGAARTGQVSAPTHELSAAYTVAESSVPAGTSALLGLGAPREEAVALATALVSTESVAQIGAATTLRGRRFRHPSVVAVLDTAHGRYVSTERAAPDRRMWSTVRPATEPSVVRAVTELLAETRAEAARSAAPMLRL